MTALTSKPQLAAIRKIGLKPGKSFEIVDQPSGKAAYVSEKSDVLTNFQLPLKYGNYGFIAHNYLAGKEFSELRIGDILTAEDKQGTTRKYRITRIEKFQARDPKSPRSKFVDLSSNKTLTADEVFKRVYAGDHGWCCRPAFPRMGTTSGAGCSSLPSLKARLKNCPHSAGPRYN